MDDVKSRITLDTEQAQKALKKLELDTDSFVDSFAKGFRRAGLEFEIFKGNIAANLAVKALETLKQVVQENVKEAIEFRRAQLQIETILPANTKLTKELIEQLDQLGQQYGTGAAVQAKTYYDIISAGIEDASDGATLLTRANELATGGVTETARTIDLLTTIYNVYGKEVALATDATDSLFKTAQIGKTNIAELSSSLGQALPIAKSFGIGLDEVGAILSQLTNAGITTSESVTLLNAVLSAIAKNGEKLGPGLNSSAVQADGLGVVLERLRQKTNGSNDALFELLGRQEAVRAVQTLTSKGLEGYNSVLAQYANKAGVASEASRKIIDNDIGKQFDILGQRISATSRQFIDSFIPAAIAATKALNEFLAPPTFSDKDAQVQLDGYRKAIVKLKQDLDNGSITSERYARSLQIMEAGVARFSGNLETAQNPLVLLTSGLEKEAENIKSQIGSLKNGFDELQLGPIERDLKIDELNNKLKATTERIKELNKVNLDLGQSSGPSRSEEAIQNELKLQADLKAIRDQFAIEEQAAQANIFAASQENEFARKQMEIDATFELESGKLAALTEAELAKTAFIKDQGEKRVQQDKILGDAQLKAIKIQNQKEVAEAQNKAAIERRLQEGNLEATGNFLQAGIMLAKEGSAVQKGLMMTQAVVNTYAGATRAMVDYPFPASAAVAASVIALGLANVAKISGAKFENGGFIPGMNQFGDNVQIRANPGEVILNTSQQREFMDLANGRSGGSSESIERLINAAFGQPIIVTIGSREIARAVRDEKAAGFAI